MPTGRLAPVTESSVACMLVPSEYQGVIAGGSRPPRPVPLLDRHVRSIFRLYIIYTSLTAPPMSPSAPISRPRPAANSTLIAANAPRRSVMPSKMCECQPPKSLRRSPRSPDSVPAHRSRLRWAVLHDDPASHVKWPTSVNVVSWLSIWVVTFAETSPPRSGARHLIPVSSDPRVPSRDGQHRTAGLHPTN